MKKEHCARAFAQSWVPGVVHGLCLVLCFIVISDVRAEEEQVKRVLIVHSFGSSAPPFTTHSTAFETTLTPFYTTKDKGLGMGLAISRSIIEVHGGRLWAECNDPEPGMTFYFTVPLWREESGAK